MRRRLGMSGWNKRNNSIYQYKGGRRRRRRRWASHRQPAGNSQMHPGSRLVEGRESRSTPYLGPSLDMTTSVDCGDVTQHTAQIVDSGTCRLISESGRDSQPHLDPRLGSQTHTKSGLIMCERASLL